MTDVSTAVPFAIKGPSPTSQLEKPERASTPSMLIVGTFVALLGTAPSLSGELSTTARPFTPPMMQTILERRNSFRQSDAIERSIARLKVFGRYTDGWDSVDAVAPSPSAIEQAIQYLNSLEPWHPEPLATVSRSGEPVLEFEEAELNFFGSLRFLRDGGLELYSKYSDQPSQFLSSQSSSRDEMNAFLSDTMNLPTI